MGRGPTPAQPAVAGGGGRRRQTDGTERVYAFQRLLRCGACGAPLYSQTQRTGFCYYRCRDCGHGIRDTKLTAWARALLEWVESYAPPAYADAVEAASAAQRPGRPADALGQVERSLERIGKRYEWGHLSDDEYKAEWAR